MKRALFFQRSCTIQVRIHGTFVLFPQEELIMKKTNLLLAAAFSMALGSIAINASACSTVVVGKDVSATGQIMIGHNEDNDLRIVTSQ